MVLSDLFMYQSISNVYVFLRMTNLKVGCEEGHQD